jgi:hypothetical protein
MSCSYRHGITGQKFQSERDKWRWFCKNKSQKYEYDLRADNERGRVLLMLLRKRINQARLCSCDTEHLCFRDLLYLLLVTDTLNIDFPGYALSY